MFYLSFDITKKKETDLELESEVFGQSGGPVEPLKFAVQPQVSTGLVGGTRDAVIWSLSKSYLHWSFAPYAEYTIFGVIIAFAFYNYRRDEEIKDMMI